jgi:hypothetical protein
MNAPPKFELFDQEGERKYAEPHIIICLHYVFTLRITYVKDTKVANAGTFTIQHEDHTLGSLLRMYVFALEMSFLVGWLVG